MGFGGLSPALASDIARLPEVGAVTGLRSTAVEIGGHIRRVSGVNGHAFSDIVDVGGVDGSLAALAALGDIGVSRDVADRDGLAVGDMVPARFAQTGLQQLRVAAIYERDEFAGDYLVGLGTYAANVAEQLDVKVFVTVAEGVRFADARAAVADAARAYPQASVQDRDEFAASAATHIDQMLNLVYALLLLAIVIALVGIANTLVLSVVERTREIGLLRAVGMTRAQIRQMVRWESVLIALLGTVLGLSLGIGFGWVLCRALEDKGVNTFVVPTGALVTIAALAAFAGVIAALAPARRAAQLDVLAAVAHG
jgi:putative ABC transport system permease protein